jgi:CHASE3 domain sensor protein
MISGRNRAVLASLFFVAIAVVGLNTWLAFRSVAALVESQHRVQHTLLVIGQVEQVMSSAKDAETGSRGFLLTGEDDYLQPYV